MLGLKGRSVNALVRWFWFGGTEAHLCEYTPKVVPPRKAYCGAFSTMWKRGTYGHKLCDKCYSLRRVVRTSNNGVTGVTTAGRNVP